MSSRADARFGARAINSKAIWWISDVKKSEEKVEKTSISSTLKNILEHVSIHCYGRIVEQGRSIWERLLWLLFHIFACVVLVMFLYQIQKSEYKVQTTLLDPVYPVQITEFPAISICPFNTINYPAAWEYAKNLSKRDPQERKADYFYNKIKLLSSFYKLEQFVDDYDDAVNFQYFLDTYDIKQGENSYNTVQAIQRISPKCKDLQTECYLAGRRFPCEEQFIETYSVVGVCCTYNAKGEHSFHKESENAYVSFPNALHVLLNSVYIEPINQSIDHTDFLVFIYSPKDYPDPSVGSVNFKIARHSEHTAVIISPTVFITSTSARIYRPKTRNCLFENEMPSTFGGSYSFSKCITHCRTRSIYVLCDCILFMTPLEYLDESSEPPVYCTLHHLACLHRYQFKWNNIITQRAAFKTLQREMEDGLFCGHCLPSCIETTYELRTQEWSYNSMTSKGNKNHTGIYVYLGGGDVSLYKQVQKDQWFEQFSSIGGLCGIITGFSLISIIEILYFVLKHFYNNWQNVRKSSESQISAETLKSSRAHEDFIILP